MPDMKNPSVVTQQIKSPIGGGIPKRIKGTSKGNAPWLKRRKDMKKIMFRGMR